MDGVSITFHVIANSNVRKSDKLQQSKAEPDALRAQAAPKGRGSAAPAFPQTQDMVGLYSGRRHHSQLNAAIWKTTAYTEGKRFSLFSYVKKNNAHTYVLQSTEASTNQFMIYGQIRKSDLNNIKEYSSGLLLQSLAMLSIEKYKTHHCTWQPEKKKKTTKKPEQP